MKIINSDALSKLESQFFKAFLLLTVESNNTTYRFTNCDINIVYKNNTYISYPFEIDNISISSDHFSDSADIKIAMLNDTAAIGLDFLNGGMQGKSVSVDLLVVLQDPSETNLMFSGKGIEKVIEGDGLTRQEFFKFNSGDNVNITHVILQLKKDTAFEDDSQIQVSVYTDNLGIPDVNLYYGSVVYGLSIKTEFSEVCFALSDLEFYLNQQYFPHYYFCNFYTPSFWNGILESLEADTDYWISLRQLPDAGSFLSISVDNYGNDLWYQDGSFLDIYPWFKMLNNLTSNDSRMYAVNIFKSVVNKWSIDEEELNFQTVSKLHKWQRRTLNHHPSNCRWQMFKGIECKYTGSEMYCDRSYSRCLELENSANFGGSRWLLDLETKEIWWGSKR